MLTELAGSNVRSHVLMTARPFASNGRFRVDIAIAQKQDGGFVGAGTKSMTGVAAATQGKQLDK